MVDPAVRSIRIAATLHERFGAIMVTPLLQTANVSDLELRIGEAQQIYPEIWNHLDEARAILAGRGIATDRYDSVRALEPKGSIGVSRVDVFGVATTWTSAALGIADETIKEAKFNREGFQRATLAIQALESAVPDVDWEALRRKESADAAAAAGAFGASNHRSIARWLAVAVGAFAVVYVFWYLVVRIPPHDYSADRQKHIAELRAQLTGAPCDTESLRSLTNEEYWETHERDHSATETEFRDLCEKQLAKDPCDRAKQRSLAAMGGKDAAKRYRDQCKASSANVAP